MSTTPRTDAASKDRPLCVPVDFARQLETELIGLQEENKRLKAQKNDQQDYANTFERQRNKAWEERDQLLATISQLKIDIAEIRSQHSSEWAEYKTDEDLRNENKRLLATVEGLREAIQFLLDQSKDQSNGIRARYSFDKNSPIEQKLKHALQSSVSPTK